MDRESAINTAAAIEFIHTYSLIHDDLPAMDDDDMRRGKPTIHKAFDEATAILAGDALQSVAFELISSCVQNFPAQNVVQASKALAIAAGAQGMVLGQAQDIAAETAGTPLNLDAVKTLQAHKTGALINWASTAAPMLAGADLKPFETYAKHVGLAFQIWDDVLDVEGDAATIGKAVNKDQSAGKATFVSILGLSGAKAAAKDEIDAAKAALDEFGERAATLRQIADFSISRHI